MKRCPKCSRTFPDESQKFCTFDGGLLRADQPAFDPNLTVRATSKELFDPSASTEHDASEAKTSVRLRSLNETITSFGTQTFPETTNLESQTSTSDLPPPPTAPELPPPPSESAPTSANLSSYAPVTVASSHNLAPPGVQPAPAASSAPPSATPVASAEAPKKKSVLPYVLVGLVLLLILGGGAATAGYFLVLKPMMEKQRGVITETPNSNTSPNANTSASPSESAPANANSSVETKKGPEPFTPPADAVQFTNSEANLDGDLAAHYVGFNFYYPKSWTKDPSSGVRGASSFAILNSKSSDETGEYLQERVIFNWYPSKGSFDADTDVFKQSSKKITDQLAKNLPEFEEVSHGETTINTYKAYEVRFKGVYKNTGGKGDLPYWGRVIFLPPGSTTDKGGIAIVMLATSLAQDVTSAADVGTKGGMALILDSLRLSSR